MKITEVESLIAKVLLLSFTFAACFYVCQHTSKDPVACKHWLNRNCSCGWWVCHGFSEHLGINQSTEQTNTLTLWWKNKMINPRWLQFFPEGKNKQKQLTSPPRKKNKKQIKATLWGRNMQNMHRIFWDINFIVASPFFLHITTTLWTTWCCFINRKRLSVFSKRFNLCVLFVPFKKLTLFYYYWWQLYAVCCNTTWNVFLCVCVCIFFCMCLIGTSARQQIS